MSDPGQERRRAQRVTLEKPISAKFGSQEVSLQEIGLVGARGESEAEMELGTKRTFSFSWGDGEVTLDARVARSRLKEQLSEALGELRYDLGLEFIETSSEQQQALKDVILSLVTEMLEVHKANARGEHWSESFPSEQPTEEKDRSLFTSCRLLSSGSWQISTIMKPVQPRDGFAVRQSTSEGELEKLKKSYQEGSDEERHLIRVMAEISTQD